MYIAKLIHIISEEEEKKMIIRRMIEGLKKAFEVRPLTEVEIMQAVHVKGVMVPLVAMREGIEEGIGGGVK
jgi:hypothetical protein